MCIGIQLWKPRENGLESPHFWRSFSQRQQIIQATGVDDVIQGKQTIGKGQKRGRKRIRKNVSI